MDDNNATYVEQETFVNSAEMQEAIQRVSDRLGFPQPLEFVDILLMYDTCRYERSFRPQEPSPWCAAFDEEDLIVSMFVISAPSRQHFRLLKRVYFSKKLHIL